MVGSDGRCYFAGWEQEASFCEGSWVELLIKRHADQFVAQWTMIMTAALVVGVMTLALVIGWDHIKKLARG